MTLKSTRDIGRKRDMAQKGEWVGGWLPHGCDVACVDRSGTERWRVIITCKWHRIKRYPDGHEEVWSGKDTFPRDRRCDEHLMLVPTQVGSRIETLNQIYS